MRKITPSPLALANALATISLSTMPGGPMGFQSRVRCWKAWWSKKFEEDS